jgi:hypothetical protein
VRPGNS